MPNGEKIVRAYLAAVGAFDAEAVASLLHADAVQIEHPNRLNPKGQRRARAQMLADMLRGAQVLRHQRYDVLSLAAADGMVATETLWEGELAIALGTLSPGDKMKAHTSIWFRIEDGQIIEQRNYDCIEAF